MTLDAMSPAEYRAMMGTQNEVVDTSGSIDEPVAEEVRSLEIHDDEKEEIKEEVTEEVKEEVKDLSPVIAQVDHLISEFEKDMELAPVVSEEVGSVDQIKSDDGLKKAGYYIYFCKKGTKGNIKGNAIKGGNMARFETKAQLKQILKSLDENDYELLKLVKGREISFEINIRKVSDITIGD
jgi:hypothetical protein